MIIMKNPMYSLEDIMDQFADCKMGEISIFEIDRKLDFIEIMIRADELFPYTKFAAEEYITGCGCRMLAVYCNPLKTA